MTTIASLPVEMFTRIFKFAIAEECRDILDSYFPYPTKNKTEFHPRRLWLALESPANTCKAWKYHIYNSPQYWLTQFTIILDPGDMETLTKLREAVNASHMSTLDVDLCISYMNLMG